MKSPIIYSAAEKTYSWKCGHMKRKNIKTYDEACRGYCAALMDTDHKFRDICQHKAWKDIFRLAGLA